MDPNPSDKALDLSGAKQAVWLVKVPKYLAESWMNSSENEPVGTLKLFKSIGKTDVTFKMTDAHEHFHSKGQPIPDEYRFYLTNVSNKSLAVFSDENEATSSNSTASRDSTIAGHKRKLEGTIVQKVDCRPVPNKKYIELKKTQQREASKPSKVTIKIDGVVQSSYKPISITREEREDIKRKKNEGKKMRMSESELQNKLFTSFEKHQYYSFKDLLNITHQPANFLNQILRKICVYGQHPEHTHMWELREEYRHHPTNSTN